MANINIGGRLHSTATGNVVAGANEILDDVKGKKQSVINQETDEALASKQTALVSGTNIKTVNGESILGSGNIQAGDPDAIKYSSQTLTDAQKTQARTNIGAYNKPASGIPTTDLASAAQTSLGKADTAYQKPQGGVPKSDLASGVQGSLDLADTAVQAENVGPILPPPETDEFATKTQAAQLDAKVTELYTPKSLGINLVNVNDSDFERGQFLNGNTLVANASYDTTGYILVDAETGYSSGLETGSLRFVSYYGENKNYLSNSENITSFTTPVDCKYIRATFYSSSWGYYMISKGDRASYEPYNPILSYLPAPADKMLIKIMGFGNYGANAGVTQDGECFYNTDFNQIWQATKFSSNRYRVIPFYPGAIYTYNGNFYIWNGTTLVKAPSDVSVLSNSVGTLESAIVDLQNGIDTNVANLQGEIDELPNTIDPVLVNPLQGVIFPVGTPSSIKSAISKVWIESSDPDNITKVINNAPTLYVYFVGNATGNYRAMIGVSPTIENPASAFSWYLNSQDSPRTQKEVVKAICRDPYFTDWELSVGRAYICFEIDWSKVTGDNRVSIALDVENLNRFEVEKSSISQFKGSIFQNSFAERTIVCFGDSITELADTSGLRYSDYLADFSGANVINVGIGGSQLRQRLEPATTPTSNGEAYAALDVVNMVTAAIEQDFTKQIAAAEYLRDHANDDNTAIVARLQSIDWSKVDIVTFFAGTNDWYGGANYGESGSLDKSRTFGAINWIIQNLLSTYPHLKIFWFTPIIRWVDYSGGTGTVEGFGDTYKPGAYTLKEFSALIQNEVGLSHIPVCDLYNTLGWNMWNFSNYFNDNDGTHPRKPDGMRGIGARFFAFLLANKNS